MIKTRIASTAALIAFGLAAVGGAVLLDAAQAYAAPSASSSASGGGGNGRVAHLDPHFAKPATGSTPSSVKLGDAGPAVPRSWYPEMPHQGG